MVRHAWITPVYRPPEPVLVTRAGSALAAAVVGGGGGVDADDDAAAADDMDEEGVAVGEGGIDLFRGCICRRVRKTS